MGPRAAGLDSLAEMSRSVLVMLAVLTFVVGVTPSARADEPEGRYTMRGCPTTVVAATALVRGGWTASAFPEGGSSSAWT